MPPTPNQIRELLLKSTDKDSNVVDMGNVLKALSYLEKTQITKEALEETRLGKTVNDIRKKTTDKDLASRCKSLVRQWQKQFVRSAQKKDPTTPAGSLETDGVSSTHSRGNVTPTGRPPSRGLQATSTSSVDKSRKENRKRRKPDTPGSATSSPSSDLVHPAKRSGQVSSFDATDSSINGLPSQGTSGIPKSAKTSKKQTKSPKAALKTTATKGANESSPLSSRKAKTRKAGLDETAPSPSGESKVPTKSNTSSRNSSPAVTNRTTQNKKHAPNVSIPKVSKVSKLSPPSTTASPSATQLSVTDKPKSSPRTPRKSPRNSTQNSTLGSNSSSPSVQPNSSGVEDGNSSVATVKLRMPEENLARNSPSVLSKSVSSSSINKGYASSTKTDVKLDNVNRTETSNRTLKPMKSIFDDDSSDEGECNTEIADPINPLNTFSLESPTRNTPEINDSDEESNVIGESAVLVNNGESFVPKSSPTCSDFPASTVLEKLEDDDEEEEEVIVRKPATTEEVEKLHTDKWEGVNGCYDDKGEWFDWTQCLSVLFKEEEPPLHILPYVSLE